MTWFKNTRRKETKKQKRRKKHANKEQQRKTKTKTRKHRKNIQSEQNKVKMGDINRQRYIQWF